MGSWKSSWIVAHWCARFKASRMVMSICAEIQWPNQKAPNLSRCSERQRAIPTPQRAKTSAESEGTAVLVRAQADSEPKQANAPATFRLHMNAYLGAVEGAIAGVEGPRDAGLFQAPLQLLQG